MAVVSGGSGQRKTKVRGVCDAPQIADYHFDGCRRWRIGPDKRVDRTTGFQPSSARANQCSTDTFPPQRAGPLLGSFPSARIDNVRAFGSQLWSSIQSVACGPTSPLMTNSSRSRRSARSRARRRADARNSGESRMRLLPGGRPVGSNRELGQKHWVSRR